MTLIQELKFWVDVIEQTAIPADGDCLTPAEQMRYHKPVECSLKRRTTRQTKWRKYDSPTQTTQ